MEKLQVTDRIAQFTQEGSNMPCCVVAFSGPDGLLLVDSGQSAQAVGLRAEIQAMGFEAPTYIINTHASLANVGGNGAFGETPTIVAHTGTSNIMRGDSHLLADLPEAAFPDEEMDAPKTIHFNGEEIRILPLPGSHTPTDMVVHFVNAGVACVGDIYGGRFFPFSAFGGKVTEFSRVMRELQEILPADTKLLYGHQAGIGELGDFDEIIQMAEETIPLVQAGLDAGKDRAALMDEPLPPKWDHLSRPGATARGWIYGVINSLLGPQAEPPSIVSPLFDGYKTDGAEGAIACYRKLVADGLEKGPGVERSLLRTAYWLLLDRAKPSDAVKLFKHWTVEFPESWNAFDSLAEGYVALGEKELAIASYKKSLELNPENENGKSELVKLGVDV